MEDAATTAALVVGIDRYDIGPTGLQPLSGAVADAAAAVAWLRALAVSPERIFLHTSPVDAPTATATGLQPQPAGERDIWGSAYRIGQLSGARLFVFLFGHATFEPRWKRLFLTQEFGVNGNWANISIDRYIDFFLSTPFQRQFLFMDGCHNLPYPQDARGRIRAGFLGGEDVTRRSDSSMVACFSCSQSERAAEIGGRGLFTRHLLEALDPAKPLSDALQLDWATGETSVDIAKLMAVLEPVVAQEAARAPGGQLQHPDYRVDGWPGPERSTILRLSVGQAFDLDVQVDPGTDADAAVRLLEVEVQDPPYWTLRRGPGDRTPIVPLGARLPRGLATRVGCLVQAGWRCQPEEVRLLADADRTVRFQLSRDRGPGGDVPGGWFPTQPGAVEVHRLFADRAGGGEWYEAHDHYDEAARALGLAAAPTPGTVVARGVTFFTHETGPEFHIQSSALRRGVGVVEDWRGALEEVTPPDVTFHLEVVRVAPTVKEPEVLFALPSGGARQLAGPLADERSLWVGPAGGDRADGASRSLLEVERQPGVPVRPGPVRVALDLPWGSWTRVVEVPEHGRRRVALPSTVGVPPLRVALDGELHRALSGTLVLGVGGVRARGWVRDGLSDGGGRPLRATSRGSSAWALAVPDEPSGSWPIVGLESGVRFPVLPGRAFGLEASGRGLRVEPLSPVPTPQWDLLVTTGRLESLDADERRELALGKWDDPLLGLAAAYAIYGAGEHTDLRTVLANTGPLLGRRRPCDLDLLQLTLNHPRGGRLAPDEVARLTSVAAGRPVPVFRWGVSLALGLVARARGAQELADWTAQLRSVEERLSPLSIWTAWMERPSRKQRRPSTTRSPG